MLKASRVSVPQHLTGSRWTRVARRKIDTNAKRNPAAAPSSLRQFSRLSATTRLPTPPGLTGPRRRSPGARRRRRAAGGKKTRAPAARAHIELTSPRHPPPPPPRAPVSWQRARALSSRSRPPGARRPLAEAVVAGPALPCPALPPPAAGGAEGRPGPRRCRERGAALRAGIVLCAAARRAGASEGTEPRCSVTQGGFARADIPFMQSAKVAISCKQATQEGLDSQEGWPGLFSHSLHLVTCRALRVAVCTIHCQNSLLLLKMPTVAPLAGMRYIFSSSLGKK
ncbi:uncharacterized protein LOC110392715 [Numida meleagris]|uniref:uncharacterized protein LOC110392715 n=1 Tax=Numida meleagris TaxID=8996 RepID=UPI000B3DF109|nr:uncharacterized protein LOC110392715 [Numida meleagris]